MTNAQLDGKIEGLANALIALISNMEQRDIIDGSHYCQTLHTGADRIRRRSTYADPETARYHALALSKIAEALDEARAIRARVQ